MADLSMPAPVLPARDLPPSAAGLWFYRLGAGMDQVRRLFQHVWVALLYCSGALWWAKRELHRMGAISVLTFHRVLDDASLSRTESLSNIVVRESSFRSLTEYVSRHYAIVDVRRARPQSGDRLRLAFTFDDGWQDTHAVAFPILKKFSAPAAVFLCSGLTNRITPFWPEQVRGTLHASLNRRYGKRAQNLMTVLIEGLKFCTPEAREQHVRLLLEQMDCVGGQPPNPTDATLSWEQIREMHQAGISFGSHTHTHQILTAVSPELAESEVRASKAIVESALGECCDTFAYPNGNWSREVRDLLESRGYRLAFTTDRRAWLPGTDLLAIPRSNVQEEDLVGLTGKFSPAMFEYATFWKIWQATRRANRQAFEKARAARQKTAVGCGA